jgi:hypothetical protein
MERIYNDTLQNGTITKNVFQNRTLQNDGTFQNGTVLKNGTLQNSRLL